MPLADRNVALNGGARPLTNASGGTATHPERAVDFAASTTWYESEAADGGQWIEADLGDVFRIVEIVARWTEEAYAPTGVRLSYGRKNDAVSDVHDPGYVTRVVLGATGAGADVLGLDVGRDDPIVKSPSPDGPVAHSGIAESSRAIVAAVAIWPNESTRSIVPTAKYGTKTLKLPARMRGRA